MKTVYLAGPITGCSYEECTRWREEFVKTVGPTVKCLDPMRDKDFLKGTDILGSCYDLPLATARGIFTRDYNDCATCDLLIVNFLDAKIASIGTCFEIAWCYQNKKPIVLIMKEDNIHNHAFITEAAGFIVKTPEEAAVLARSILGVE